MDTQDALNKIERRRKKHNLSEKERRKKQDSQIRRLKEKIGISDNEKLNIRTVIERAVEYIEVCLFLILFDSYKQY